MTSPANPPARRYRVVCEGVSLDRTWRSPHDACVWAARYLGDDYEWHLVAEPVTRVVVDQRLLDLCDAP